MKSLKPQQAGAILLGVAMGALAFGFALFFLTPSEASASPLLWTISTATAMAVALPNFRHTTQPAKPQRS